MAKILVSVCSLQGMRCMYSAMGNYQVRYANYGKEKHSKNVICFQCFCGILFAGSAFGTRTDRRFTYNGNVNLQAGSNIISLLSVAVGLPVSSLLLHKGSSK